MSIGVDYLNPVMFSDERHIANFVRYLFNLTPKHENELTKENFYLYFDGNKVINVKAKWESEKGTEFDEREFREIHAKVTTRRAQELFAIDKTLAINDMFYIIFDDKEQAPKFDEMLKKIHGIESNLEEFVKQVMHDFQKPIFNQIIKECFIVGHLNQDSPAHLHRMVLIDKEKIVL